MVRAIAICVALLAGVGTARAQTGPRTGGPAPGDFQGTRAAVDLGITGNLARGIADRNLVILRGGINFWTGRFGVFVQPYYLFGDVRLSPTAARVKTDDERYLRTLVYYTFADPLFVYGVTALDASLRRRIDKRVLAGGGLGATIVNRPGLTFLTAVGLLYEHAYFDGFVLPDMTVLARPKDREAVRTSLRVYGRYKVSERLNLVHDIYLIPNVRNFDDLRAMISGVVELPITAGFAGRIAVDATHEGYIVRGTQENDIAITFGLSYKNDWTLGGAAPPTPAK